ncbi:hypothetical protein BGZ51_003472 [Haplosporangium sp. Z 767]|nr:hypothetical protein BGZ51_003472 [Haplosporangium sp. Z 767]KAF9184855.1 hypothetical protein BGZ50_003422 [Haplosporangium sp. Z 11]
MTPTSIPSATALATGTRALSTASRNRPLTLVSGFTSRLGKAGSRLESGRTVAIQTQLQQQQQHLTATTALFSTSSSSSSKEEEDLYQALTVSFRTRLAEQIHKPEDGYKAVIEQWAVHNQNDSQNRQRTRARKERLEYATKHKDINWIQKEQERLELEINSNVDDSFLLIQAWIKCGELKRATLAFEKMESVGVPLGVPTLAALIRAHARSGNMAVADKMVQKMKDIDLHTTSIYNLSALLEYYIKTMPTSSSSYSTSTASPTSFSANNAGTTTTQRTSSNPSQERVHEIWKAIEHQLRRLDSISGMALNNISLAYKKYLTFLVNDIHDLENAAELIDRMVAKDISPGVESYPKRARLILRRLIKHGYFTEVVKLLGQKDAALAKKMPQTIWDDLMEACMSRNENQMARRVYDDMIRYGIPRSAKCQKMFSELQQLGDSPVTEGEISDILSILFNRQSKPALS